MKLFRFGWRATLLIIWVLVGLVVLACVFPWASMRWRQAITRWWSSRLLVFCGVQVNYMGTVVCDLPVLFVLNHVSWLDIFILNQARTTAFVAKSEIRHWPFLGWLVAWSGTVFIDRSQRHAIKQVADQMKTKFSHHLAVGLFPEGTTSTGLDVQKFHSSLFETAIATAVDVQPVALRFYDGAQRSARVAFVGEQTLLQNVWLLLSQPGARVECEFLSVLKQADNAQRGRVATAKMAHQAIQQAVLKGL